MDATLNQFNRIAGVYDALASIVFGRSLHEAQLIYQGRIPSSANILILGGGTGKILPPLLKANSTSEVYYVEASSCMIALAKKNVASLKTSVIHFIHGTVDSIPAGVKFDAVITSFFLDMFSPATLDAVVSQVGSCLSERGVWIATDFVSSKKRKHKTLLWVMYLFFRRIARIEARQLPLWEDSVKAAGFREAKSELFFDGFIKAVLYQKQ